jgi:hypothetical protein
MIDSLITGILMRFYNFFEPIVESLSVPAWFSFAMSVCPLYHLKAQAGLANLRAQNTSQLKLLTQRHLRL